jgi:hypothetical protein
VHFTHLIFNNEARIVNSLIKCRDGFISFVNEVKGNDNNSNPSITTCTDQTSNLLVNIKMNFDTYLLQPLLYTQLYNADIFIYPLLFK